MMRVAPYPMANETIACCCEARSWMLEVGTELRPEMAVFEVLTKLGSLQEVAGSEI